VIRRPKVDRQPNAREQRQFGRLQRIAKELDLNSLYVRLPKPWLIDEEIDPNKLAKFTKELCKEVKKAVDEGMIGPGKDQLSIERFFEELTKARNPAPKKPEEPAPDRGSRKR